MVLRIFQMIDTSGFLVALECTEFVFGRGSAPDPTGGAYSAPPDPLAGLRALLLRGREKDGEGTGERGEEMDGRYHPSFRKFLDPPLHAFYTGKGGFKNSEPIAGGRPPPPPPTLNSPLSLPYYLSVF